MRLLINPISTFSQVAACYLAEKGVAAELVLLERGADRGRLDEVSAAGQVPVLETEHGVVTGSQAICDHVDLVQPEPSLLPTDPRARRACRQLEDLACTATDALQFLVHMIGFRRPELQRDVPGVLDRVDAAVRDHYVYLDSLFRSEPLASTGFTRSDLFCFPMVVSLVFMDRPIPETLPALRAWFARVRERPHVAESLARAARSYAAQEASGDPYFLADRIHWRDHRLEWAYRVGLGAWLAEDLEARRAFLSPAPGAKPDRACGALPQQPR